MSEHDGKGADRMGTRKDGLRFRWQWIRVCMRSWAHGDKRNESQKREPCQTCEAETRQIRVADGGNFELNAIAWANDPRGESYCYEAQVEWVGNHLLSGGRFKTRLEAQVKAEGMLKEYLTKSLELFDD